MINLEKELEFIKNLESEDKKRRSLGGLRKKTDRINKEKIINKLPNELRSKGFKEYNNYDYYLDNYT